MALTKKFTDQVIALSNRGVQVAESAHTLGKIAVKAAYSNADLEPAQYLMDNLPKYIQRAMFNWFKRAGLDTIAPTTGEKFYKVVQVIDQKRQQKTFEWVEANPVMVTEVKEVAAPKEKVLKGTALERSHKAMQSLITRLKETDPEASALINDIYATMSYTNVLFDAQGKQTQLESAEVELIDKMLKERGARVRLAA